MQKTANDLRRSQRSSKARTFYRLIGSIGWQTSDYYTDTFIYPALRRWLSKRIPAEGGPVVSVGCGTAELEKFVSQRRDLRIIGMDSSLEMLQAAARIGSCALIQADAHSLPLNSNSCSGAMLIESIGHLQLESALPEIARVLGQRGWLLITTYAPSRAVHGSYKKFTATRIARLLSKAGFSVEDQRLLSPGKKAVREVRSPKQSKLIYLFARKARPSDAKSSHRTQQSRRDPQ